MQSTTASRAPSGGTCGRPSAASWGAVNVYVTYRLESISADELVLVLADGTAETWTRAPAD